MNDDTAIVNESFQKKADYFDAILKAFDGYRQAAYSTKIDLLQWFCDLSIFTLFGSYDLWIVVCDYNKSIKKYQQIYYSRQAALICFELLSDIPQHLNKNFNLLIKIIDNPEITNRFEELRKKFNQYKNENESKFKDIRDYTAAHRDHNITNQIVILNSINNDWVMSFSMEYLNLISDFHCECNKINNFITNDMKVLGKDKFQNKYGKINANSI